MDRTNNVIRSKYLSDLANGLMITTFLATSSISANQTNNCISNSPISTYLYHLNNNTINESKSMEFKYGTSISFEQEIQSISAILEEKIGSKIIDYWIPVDNSPEGSMLLVELENQKTLEKQYDDLELHLYLLLKEDLKKFEKINFVALF